ncbi:hypothetical protein ACIBCM_06465 [Streptomyces sp. NPDC051018]|uniref:hypothetical protein n=1 Tax=Streptomyces sp. NPDC051018 TaxID=3365639 RepID=UPI0037AB4A49
MSRTYENYFRAAYGIDPEGEKLSPRIHEMAKEAVVIEERSVRNHAKMILADLPSLLQRWSLGEEGYVALANLDEVVIPSEPNAQVIELMMRGLFRAPSAKRLAALYAGKDDNRWIGDYDDYDIEHFTCSELPEELILPVLFAADAKPVEARLTLSPDPDEVRIRLAEPNADTVYAIARVIYEIETELPKRNPDASEFWSARTLST